ncbi:MAG: lipocalin family protein [Pseudomonadota bacterium]
MGIPSPLARVKRAVLPGVWLLTSVLLTAGCLGGPSYRDARVPLETAAQVNVDRYLGTWYEIARLPNRFEKNCEGVTAQYDRRPDGLLLVVNTCRKGGIDGPADSAVGRAKIVDTQTNAKLKVSFFGPFWGDYWILDVDPDYQIALVGEPSGKFLWILARTPTLAPRERELALRKLMGFGYDTSALYFTRQPPGGTR